MLTEKQKERREKKRLYCKQYRIDNPLSGKDKRRIFKNHIHNHYKMTVAEYKRRLKEQGGKCAICKGDSGKNRFSVDHDHKCCSGGKTCRKCSRGLLCIRCNLIIGRARDCIATLKSAIEYLEKWT